ncbi:hypothetical protein AB6A40_006976 [Gnathostoma spinigerum]|uniref:Uncharacterized protein n=1 Tax=Gnathostoma spinigerum TaxID=75299 RepID=A0ABD6EU98_9BILA
MMPQVSRVQQLQSQPQQEQPQQVGVANLERMPRLKQLVLSTDDDASTSYRPMVRETPSGPSTIDQLLSEGPLTETNLGKAVDNLLISWNQLFLDISARSGFMTPIVDHVKEVAECATRQLKDACQELNGQFARVALEWRIAHPDEALMEVLFLN